MRIAVTADLHYGTRHGDGQKATEALAARLHADPPDLLILAGDIGAGDDFEKCLALFDGLDCQKAAVPGNHDVWVRPYDARGDSLNVYEHVLPEICRRHGFTYLDQEPLLLPEHGLGIVGTMNWYDYTWDNNLLRQATPDWEERLRTKRFTQGMHNDANFVRWPLTDVQFTDRIVAQFEKHLDETLAQVPQAIVVAHHPPLRGLLYPSREPPPLDALLWRAFSGNMRVEALIAAKTDRIPFTFCGHTHAARECVAGSTKGINIGGDYHFKRLILLDWPAGDVVEAEFRF